MEAQPAPTPREHLLAALRRVPPTAPTVCEGWQARHLAAHVVLRERSPIRLARALAQGRDLAVERGNEVVDLATYEALLDDVAAGPGARSPMEWWPVVNTLEFEVHAMDVERGGGPPAEPKQLPAPIAGRLWRTVTVAGRVLFARAAARGGVGVVFVVPGGPRAVLARGETSVVVTGTVAELALVVTGRARVSLAALTGPRAAVDAFAATVGFVAGTTGR